jgi:hypothetical protein
MLRRMLIVFVIPAAAACFAGTAAADPSHNVLPEFSLSCSDGQSLTVQPGTATNNSSIAFVRDSTSIFVAKSFVGTLGGEPQFGFERGLKGFDKADVVTCTGTWTVEGVTYDVTVTGFITPARL